MRYPDEERMPEGPYRATPPEPEATTKLARLATEGQHRILEASERAAAARQELEVRQRKVAERHLRVALGGHYGAPVRTVAHVLIAVGALMVVAFVWDVPRLLRIVPGVIVLLGGLLVRWLAPPVATRARVDAERRWARSLPFTMEGYFEVLAGEPRRDFRLAVSVTWSDPGRSPSEDVLRGVLGRLDTGADIVSDDRAAVTLRSRAISCVTGFRVNDEHVYRNTRIVAYVHDLVDEVLLPLHEKHAILRVSLARS
jgi:hypothetical protein